MHTRKRPQTLVAGLAGLLLFLLFFSSISSSAAPIRQGESLDNPPTVIYYAAELPGGSRVRALASEYLLAAAPKTASIKVNYIGSWDPEAKAAVEYAKGIWETQIASGVPILVEARWDNMGAGVLGGAGANGYRRNFTGSTFPDTWYPFALANSLAGKDLDTAKVDIKASFNSAFSAWYFGADGSPQFNQYDFVSVALHEIGHGLGFIGSMSVSNGLGSWGSSSSPFIYDLFAVDSSGESLLTGYPNNSTALGDQLRSGGLFFSGSHAAAANGGTSPQLYAPSRWDAGSSYSHLDEKTFGAGGGNNLMTPSLANREVIHLPGPVALGIFQDLGWTTGPAVEATLTPTPANSPTPTPPSSSAAQGTPRPTYAFVEYLPSIFSLAPTRVP
jgi:hypothetical protein